ncbi:Alpha/Beta hydrolase protein [Podospora fimiseda]|uniref:Alpha/Beta hydrolase protein n=1 Tax=Podospora fimiseda TaxID=252190 RepID=A0AAN7BG46_9PEZI|nr:Alpha/Beta hydrolase protein [Podospora fimiseda]
MTTTTTTTTTTTSILPTLHQPLWARTLPFTLLYTTYFLVLLLPLKTLYYSIRYYFPSYRPLPTWTFRQSLTLSLIKLIFGFIATVEYNPFRFGLKPGSEGNRFVVIDPFDQDEYTAMAKPNEDVKPGIVAGVWTPEKPEEGGKGVGRVYMHFHGGGYTMFDCRDLFLKFGASLLLDATKTEVNAKAFAVRYRLSSEKEGKRGMFPAALQDAITAYRYVVERLGIDSGKVVFSGDSAGGNLALALLRYLEEQDGGGKRLPLPGGILLWSPWVDLSIPPSRFPSMKNFETDMVLPANTGWGYRTFIPREMTENHPYISPVKKVLETKVPIWVNWGGKEVYDGVIREFIENQRRTGKGPVGDFVIEDAPHDMLGCGEVMGWVDETREAAADGIRFLDEHMGKK